MDYIVFGDDWKSHSSTTQHLINHLSDKDKVIWINSIGMRAPELNLYDVKRLIKKAVDMIKNDKEKESEQTFKPLSIIQPKIIPFHKTAIVKKINRLQIHYLLKSIINKHQLKQPIILTANPVVTDYLPKRYLSRLCYLRLDNYALYGGVDKQLAIDSEKLTLKKARVVFYTAKELDPKRNIGKDVYLPQGVDIENFKCNEPPQDNKKTIGFFGLIEPSRYDFEFIKKAALANPDWQFEFLGNSTYKPELLTAVVNIKFRPGVAYSELGQATSHWHAAWIPYKVNELTKSINPLKVREYLALGLPVISSDLPEVTSMNNDIVIYKVVRDIKMFLKRIKKLDNWKMRLARSESVKSESWSSRAECLSLYCSSLVHE